MLAPLLSAVLLLTSSGTSSWASTRHETTLSTSASSPATGTALALASAPPSTTNQPIDNGEPPAGSLAVPTMSDEAVEAYQDEINQALIPRAGGLTAQEVARRAAISSPAITIKRAELRATAAELDRTMVRYVPSVSAQLGYTRNSAVDIDLGGDGASVVAANEGPIGIGPCPDGSGNQCVLDSGGSPLFAAGFAPIEIPLNTYSLQASLSVPFSEYALRLLPAKRGSDRELESATLRRDAELARVQLDAKLAYYDWLRAVAVLASAQRSIADANARLLDGKAGLAAGILTSTDVLRLEQLVSSAEVARLQAVSVERFARRNLAVIMGEDQIDFAVGENVFEPVAPLPAWGSREELVHEAQTSRAEVRALLRSSDALGYAVKALRGDLYPRLSGFFDFTYANPNQRFFPATEEWNYSWNAGVSLGWQLGQFLDARLYRKKLSTDAEVMRARVVELRRAIELEVTVAWEEYTRAEAALVLDKYSAKVAQAAYDEQVALYQAGEATTTDIVAAELTRSNSTLREVNDRIDLRVAAAKLSRATGRQAPPVPGQRPTSTSAAPTIGPVEPSRGESSPTPGMP